MTYKNNLNDWAEVAAIVRENAEKVKPLNMRELGEEYFEIVSRQKILVDFVDDLFKAARRARCIFEHDAKAAGPNGWKCHRWEPKQAKELKRLEVIGRVWFGVQVGSCNGYVTIDDMSGAHRLATLEA